MNALSALGVTTYIREIMGEGNTTTWRMQCSKSIPARYDSLQATTEGDGRIQFLFALDLYQAIPVLPTLLGSIIQVIRFLDPNRCCAVSVVEGRPTDGTYQVLAALQDEIERLGAVFYLSTSDVSPQDGKQDRFERPSISKEPGVGAIGHGKSEEMQHATMTCGMDWSHDGAIFYDIYVARSLVGETFWQIAQDGGWQFSGNLFWADRQTSAKYLSHQPFQVYACWNGGAVISARPIMERQIRFRRNVDAECYMGEPTLFAKDLWRLGLGRIQVVPTVNVGYDNRTEEAKDRHGRVEDYLNMTSGDLQTEPVQWQESPPSLVKCMAQFHEPRIRRLLYHKEPEMLL
ncbi:MAG: hypothetical protein Q9161_004053 [Pseudevernia consocians]